jgi:hypothetical protein
LNDTHDVELTKSVEDARNREPDLHKVQGVNEQSNNKDDDGKDGVTRNRGVRDQNKKTPPKKKARKADDMDSGAESHSSRRTLRRSPRGHTTNKKTKSPLPVEIVKVKSVL